MIAEDSVNSQIVDSVSQANVTNIGQGAASTTAMVEAASAESIGMAMYNAVTTQQNMQMLTTASITSACARMLSITPPIPSAPAEADKQSTLPPLVPVKPTTPVDPKAQDDKDKQNDDQDPTS